MDGQVSSNFILRGQSCSYRVEGSSINDLIDLVGTSDSVRSEERDNLEGREVAGIRETLENFGHAVLGLGDQGIDSDNGRARATG